MNKYIDIDKMYIAIAAIAVRAKYIKIIIKRKNKRAVKALIEFIYDRKKIVISVKNTNNIELTHVLNLKKEIEGKNEPDIKINLIEEILRSYICKVHIKI